MSRADLEDALVSVVRTASGLADGRVIWSNQDGPDIDSEDSDGTSTPYITLKLDGPRIMGIDAEQTEYDEDADPGEEIEVSIGGMREYSLSVQVFSGDDVGNGSASALAAYTQARLGLSSVRLLLHSAGASCFDKGTIRNVPAIKNAEFEARAQFDARFYIDEAATELTTFIETVEADGGDLGELTLDVEA